MQKCIKKKFSPGGVIGSTQWWKIPSYFYFFLTLPLSTEVLHCTRLSRHVWKLKEANPPVPFQLKVSIVKLAQSYTKKERWFCFLCQAEKTFIAYSEHFSTLNQRSEILNKCRHRRKFLLMNWRWGSLGFFKKSIPPLKLFWQKIVGKNI